MTEEETIRKDLAEMREKARKIIEGSPIFAAYAKKLKENIGSGVLTIHRDPENLSTR
jgi:hypothetical protein